MNMKEVSGERVLITGGAQGLGRLLALEFCKKGARVAIWDKNVVASEETVRLGKELGGTICYYYCELSNKENIYKAAGQVKEDFGGIDILINNAGTVSGHNFMDSSDEELETTNQVNFMAQLWATRCFLPSMLESNHGHIVCVSSALGLGGISGLVDYTASKFGIIGFLETLNLEIEFGGYDGVKTTIVCPYHTRTSMFEGCRIRFKGIFDAVDPHYVTKRTMQAILTNQYIVCIPRIVYFVALSRMFLPVDAMLKVHNFTGVRTFMDGFWERTSDDKKRVNNKKDS